VAVDRHAAAGQMARRTASTTSARWPDDEGVGFTLLRVEPAQPPPVLIDADFADLSTDPLWYDGRTLGFRFPP
jgi:hypothetical protein